jgi:hypothetical protein
VSIIKVSGVVARWLPVLAALRAGRWMPRSRIPRMGRVLVTPHAGAAPCQYLALESTGHADHHGRDGMIGRPVL